MKPWRRRSRSFFSLLLFGVTVLVLFGTIRIVNWLPLAIQKETFRPYPDVEAMNKALSFENLRIPQYFPDVIPWPPVRVLAQAKPYKAVLILFGSTLNGSEGLTIMAAESAHFRALVPDRLVSVEERAFFELRGIRALLEVGADESGLTVSRISWRHDRLFYTLTMPGPPFELIKIAESMGPEFPAVPGGGRSSFRFD